VVYHDAAHAIHVTDILEELCLRDARVQHQDINCTATQGQYRLHRCTEHMATRYVYTGTQCP